jgi:acyl-coenzyme A thioesterase PaaI-like protein
MSKLSNLKETALLRAFAFAKIPMLLWIRPTVVELDEDRCVISIPLSRRTRNHLWSMYFGVLCTGADLAGGYVAMREIKRSGRDVAFVFKDFRAEFLKRAEGDVHFVCTQGRAVAGLVQRAIDEPGTRVEDTVSVVAMVPSKLGEEPAARFELTISLKLK